jgi:hypothetical protein
MARYRETCLSRPSGTYPQEPRLDLEPETVELVDQPLVDKGPPFRPVRGHVPGRYSVEDWNTSSASWPGDTAKLENYIGVMAAYTARSRTRAQRGSCTRWRDREGGVAISRAPSGRVSGKQINDAVQDALASGVLGSRSRLGL